MSSSSTAAEGLRQVPDPFMPELQPPGYEEDEDDYDSSEDSDDDEPEPFEIDFEGIWASSVV